MHWTRFHRDGMKKNSSQLLRRKRKCHLSKIGAWGILLFLTGTVPGLNSDFNVIIPEICNAPNLVNLTWIQSMVYLGIRDEQSQLTFNILGPDGTCDGSKGLLKFISMAYADPNGQMIASLPPHLCPTAATFCHLNSRQFLSWTCPKMPGVISLKPQLNDVILAIQRLLRYFRWHNVALTKSRFDGSPFCDEVGAYLQNDSRHNNSSVMILGNYEDLVQYETTSVTNNLDGLFLCISYDYGFTHNLSQKTVLNNRAFGHGRIPLVLLPEWPLPVEIFSPENPTLALIANTHPLSPTSSTSSFDFHPKSWDSVEADKETIMPHKLLETLVAQMILKSVKISLELERETSLPSLASRSPNHNFHHYPSHVNGKTSHFLFSILQFEKARWHPLINLVNGENHLTKSPMDGRTLASDKSNESNTDTSDLENTYLFTWFKILLVMFVSVILLVGFVVVYSYFRNRVKNQAFYGAANARTYSRRRRSQGPYKIILTSTDISFGSVTVEPVKKTRSPFMSNISNLSRQSQDKPDLLKGSFGTLRKTSSVTNLKNEPGLLIGENTARYKGDMVYLRKLPVSSESFEIKMKAMIVLETLHGLRHENLVAMLGCFTDGESPAVVWEYCSRGSLHDIIKQSDIKLDWAFKLSLLSDLVRGMRYLHSSMVRSHGFLSSYNCVIDARWVLKITDYGLPALYHTQGLPLPPKSAKDLLWTAPELLRDDTLRRQGTQGGDVFSFAIMMQEILVRGEPYCMLTLTAEEILEKVKHPPPLIRPSVSKGCAPPEAINIMRQCWAELPDMRPDFVVIHDLFKTLNHGRKANIVDTMFQMLEKYSNNLEELIRERTEQLDLEKKKTEQLLNRMLPSTVAEKLKLGLPVDPEEFSEVTIYFSDIVGFTTISAYSTPFEVVDLLNDLYTCFDGTINDYNVYKVETIGDAYMVVGGAPLWSPDHADQIATMALDLLHQSGKFRIRHLPFTPLRLRIGLHTGPCCAGVVGLTMPRYCLFGDTVNTASRMESTGAAWRIHISGETKAKLDEAGGYITESRGTTDIKGKGPMHTYWLLGKEGFDKELPTPPGLNEGHGLDENSIKFGRTGIKPGIDVEVKDTPPIINPVTEVAKPKITSHKLAKPSSSYALVGGENVRTLSPAEQVAHQLLNGRPTTRGLRRQLSLDQQSMPYLLMQAKQAMAAAALRRAPSLEDNSQIGVATESEVTAKSSLSTIPSAATSNNSVTPTTSGTSTPGAVVVPLNPGASSKSPNKSPVGKQPSDCPSVSIAMENICAINVQSHVSPNPNASTNASVILIPSPIRESNDASNVAISIPNPPSILKHTRSLKLSKILSVVEESPVLDRKFPNGIVSKFS